MNIRNIFNFLIFLFAVLSCTLVGSYLSIFVVVATLYVHLKCISVRRGEMEMILVVGFLGMLIDSVLMHMGVMDFSGYKWFIPFWLTCNWLIFATTLNHAFAWMRKYPAISMISGGIFGPLAYFGGTKLGVLSFSHFTWYSVSFLAATWACLMWFLPKLSAQITEARPV